MLLFIKSFEIHPTKYLFYTINQWTYTRDKNLSITLLRLLVYVHGSYQTWSQKQRTYWTHFRGCSQPQSWKEPLVMVMCTLLPQTMFSQHPGRGHLRIHHLRF